MAISLQQLRYLSAIAEHGSLTAAAAQLGVSQPVLSRALAALQADLNSTLVSRRDRKLVLTPDGEAALGAARRALAAVEDMKRSTLRKQTPPLLRMAASPAVLPFVTRALRAILEIHPGMHVRVLASDTAEVMSNLLSTGQADLGLGEKSAPRGGMRWAPLETAEVVLASPPGADLPAVLEIRDLADTPLVSVSASTGRQRAFDDLFLRAGVRPNIILEVEESANLLPMVQGRVGSVFAWRFLAEHAPGVEVRSFQPRHVVEIGFSYLETPNRHVREFVDLARGMAQERTGP